MLEQLEQMHFIITCCLVHTSCLFSLGLLILYGMTMGGMTSMLTNIDSRRSTYIHTYKAFEAELVCFCGLRMIKTCVFVNNHHYVAKYSYIAIICSCFFRCFIHYFECY